MDDHIHNHARCVSCHDLLRGNPTSCENVLCRGNSMTCVMKIPQLVLWKQNFPRQTKDFYTPNTA